MSDFAKQALENLQNAVWKCQIQLKEATEQLKEAMKQLKEVTEQLEVSTKQLQDLNSHKKANEILNKYEMLGPLEQRGLWTRNPEICKFVSENNLLSILKHVHNYLLEVFECDICVDVKLELNKMYTSDPQLVIKVQSKEVSTLQQHRDFWRKMKALNPYKANMIILYPIPSNNSK